MFLGTDLALPGKLKALLEVSSLLVIQVVDVEVLDRVAEGAGFGVRVYKVTWRLCIVRL